jgi:hypothetical protein
MPREKDFKRHVRRRMTETGERYTRAREALREGDAFDWRLTQATDGAYEALVEAERGKRVDVLSSVAGRDARAGTLTTTVSAEPYRGGRVRYAAQVRGDGVALQVGLWMRVQDGEGAILAFDNMGDRPLRGSFGWRPAEVVLDVPEAAATIALGVYLTGTGSLRVTGVHLGAADADAWPSRPPTVDGWLFKRGWESGYELGSERGPEGETVSVLRAPSGRAGGQASISRNADAAPYRDGRVRLRARLRTEDAGSVRLAMGVFDGQGQTMALDTMDDRPLSGTTAWVPISIVLDVPADALVINYSLQLAGGGSAGVADVRLDAVPTDVPATGWSRAAGGWILNGARPDTYDVTEEVSPAPGRSQVVVRSKAEAAGAVLTRWAMDAAHPGRTVRFTVSLEGEEVEPGAGALMISPILPGPPADADGRPGTQEEQMLRGTFDWRELAVEAAIPEEAVGVACGITIAGRGTVRIADPRIEVVGG